MAVALCCGLGAVAGCTRTSDGSVELQPPVIVTMPKLAMPKMAMPNFLKFGVGARDPQPTAVAASATRFPPPPVQAAPTAAWVKSPSVNKRLRPRRVSANPAVPPNAEPGKPLACKNVSQASGRIRYFCA